MQAFVTGMHSAFIVSVALVIIGAVFSMVRGPAPARQMERRPASTDGD
jgi:hypothetical protein